MRTYTGTFSMEGTFSIEAEDAKDAANKATRELRALGFASDFETLDVDTATAGVDK